MTPSFKTQATLAFMLTAFLAAAPALADKDKEHGRGKSEDKWEKHERKQDEKWEKKERKHKDRDDDERHSRRDRHGRDQVRAGAFFTEDHRTGVRTYYTQHYGGGKGCPPGLAKKHNGCLPPGQAWKYSVGEPLPREVVYYPVPQPVIVRLPATPVGYRYVRVGNDILLLSPQSAVVMDVIAGVLR